MDVVVRHHAELQRLLVRLASRPEVGEESIGGEIRQTQQPLADLRRRFITHEIAKQRFFWPVARRAWLEGSVLASAAIGRRRGVEE